MNKKTFEYEKCAKQKVLPAGFKLRRTKAVTTSMIMKYKVFIAVGGELIVYMQ